MGCSTSLNQSKDPMVRKNTITLLPVTSEPIISQEVEQNNAVQQDNIRSPPAEAGQTNYLRPQPESNILNYCSTEIKDKYQQSMKRTISEQDNDGSPDVIQRRVVIQLHPVERSFEAIDPIEEIKLPTEDNEKLIATFDTLNINFIKEENTNQKQGNVKRVNLIDLVRSRSQSSTLNVQSAEEPKIILDKVSSIEESQPLIIKKKLLKSLDLSGQINDFQGIHRKDLLEILKRKLKEPVKQNQEQKDVEIQPFDDKQQKKTLLKKLTEFYSEVVEEEQEQSSFEQEMVVSDNKQESSLVQSIEKKQANDYFYLTTSQQKNQQLRCNSMQDEVSISNSNVSFVVREESIQNLNLDKYQLRCENLQISYEQKSNRSQEDLSLVRGLTINNHSNQFISSPPNILGDYGRPKTKTFTYLSPNNYLNPSSFKRRSSNQCVSVPMAVVETDKMEKSFDEQGNKKINNYVILGDIGRGGFGKVKKIFDATNQNVYALKIANKAKLKKKLLSRTKSAYTFLEQEVAILKKMDHPNIVRLSEVIDDPEHDKLYIIMDYIEKGPINSKRYWMNTDKSKLNQDNEFDTPPFIEETKLRKYVRDFLEGIFYSNFSSIFFNRNKVHNVANVIHRDIKPDNLLVDKNDTLKIADFGVAQIIEINEDIEGDVGTKAFLSPEAFKSKGTYNGKAADIWAFGVCFFYLATGILPFKAQKLEELKQQILTAEPYFPENMNEQLKDMLQQCLEKQAHKRIYLDNLMTHPWVTQNGEDPLLYLDGDQDNEYQHLIISENDVMQALSGLTFRATVQITAKLKKKLNQSRLRISSRSQILGNTLVLLIFLE